MKGYYLHINIFTPNISHTHTPKVDEHDVSTTFHLDTLVPRVFAMERVKHAILEAAKRPESRTEVGVMLKAAVITVLFCFSIYTQCFSCANHNCQESYAHPVSTVTSRPPFGIIIAVGNARRRCGVHSNCCAVVLR